MATPMTAAQFKAALEAEGVTVQEVGDWTNHNRNHKGAWGPVNGVIIHHTAGSGAGQVQLCYDGYDELPGPLCHGVIDKAGVVHLVGNGRTNHAGGGDPDTLAHVVAEDYDVTTTLVPHKGNSDGVDGNAHFYGFECVNKGDGKDPWPDAQVDAIVRASAAICRHYGWSAASVIGHKEWSDDKPDPRGSKVGMPDLRAAIAARLGTGVPSTPKPPVPPVPSIARVSVSQVAQAARRDPGLPQGGTTFPKAVKPVEAALAKLGYLAPGYAGDGSFGSLTVKAYAAFQRSLGYRGADADGVPGKTSLSVLADRTRLFIVTN